MQSSYTDPYIVVSLDVPSAADALALADQLPPERCRMKIGKELFTRAGPALLETLHERGYRTFLDLKYHDIPNTVARACEAAAALGTWMVNVHAGGGRAMLSTARKALDKRFANGEDIPLLVAVTVLTSLRNPDLKELGIEEDVNRHVIRLAKLAKDCGLDGVVCSANEIESVRKACGRDFCLVTPGIRPANAEAGDQKRIATPTSAIQAGADYLVIGRPITRADDPNIALLGIEEEIEAAR
ncbi:MAG: orotidine-5'-phosphate decarboxylase [Candidatus Eutrophobiaceae bacterium]